MVINVLQQKKIVLKVMVFFTEVIGSPRSSYEKGMFIKYMSEARAENLREEQVHLRQVDCLIIDTLNALQHNQPALPDVEDSSNISSACCKFAFNNCSEIGKPK